MTIIRDFSFAEVSGDSRSAVFEVQPKVFSDSRGSFCEVLKQQDDAQNEDSPAWFSNTSWIMQVNRSTSKPGVIRGCHAQTGAYCQGKLVQSLTARIFDVITDARPDSRTFGVSNVYVLDPTAQNQLWVPRGFLHAFVVPETSKCDAVFEYFCDNVYDRSSEIGVNPTTLLPAVGEVLSRIHKDDTKSTEKYLEFFKAVKSIGSGMLSEKDLHADDYDEFMSNVMDKYEKTGKVWYR
jgi:dTDP-4-dehydrorhamnose 3,5-epimerase